MNSEISLLLQLEVAARAYDHALLWNYDDDTVGVIKVAMRDLFEKLENLRESKFAEEGIQQFIETETTKFKNGVYGF